MNVSVCNCLFRVHKGGNRMESTSALNYLYHEICCDFTHMIVTDGIDIDSNDMPLCGAV